jgi:hypothetical protein
MNKTIRKGLKRRFKKGSLECRLSRFNAKERFALIQRVLGVDFVPHDDFVAEILRECEIMADHRDVFCAMDFHLDWLYAALINKELNPDLRMPLVADKDFGAPVTGRQQDADFILCFTDEASDKTHLLLIEAKGVGSWDTKQIRSKLNQYRAMREAFAANPNVAPRLILMSQKDPNGKKAGPTLEFLRVIDEFKDFGKVVWLELPMPTTYAVVRCLEDGTPNKDAPTNWKLQERKGSGFLPCIGETAGSEIE